MNRQCGCCDGVHIATPMTECNPPGLSALAYRAGTYATFYETMLARLSSLYLDIPSVNGTGTDRLYPLKGLNTRDPADPSIALLDAWAVIGDVLTFYQERIANEGYLPTALERRSILELARLVGYRLRPGVAASVYLAFTTAKNFEGNLPAGTRAQSIPGPGELPQFFETSDVLAARDVWNAIPVRLTRPQSISPPDTTSAEPAVTAANVIDTVYLDGTATNLKTGDMLLFVFGDDDGEQVLRRIETVDAQADAKRTEITLVPDPTSDLQTRVQLLLDKASQLFPDSLLADAVSGILTDLKTNLAAAAAASPNAVGIPDSNDLVSLAMGLIREQQAIAVARGFTRLSAFIAHALLILPAPSITAVAVLAEGSSAMMAAAPASPPPATPTPSGNYASAQAYSPLGNLLKIAAPLAMAPSVQPRNAIQMSRSVAQSFSPQSDIAARMVAAFKPQIGNLALYGAWTNIPRSGDLTEVQAVRVKAALFASRDPGGALGSPSAVPKYTAPTLGTAWLALGTGTTVPSAVALDATYDQIKPGSWVAIDRPHIAAGTAPPSGPGAFADGARIVTYHVVTDLRTSAMDAADGFTATVTLLTLDPPWLSDVAVGTNDETLTNVLGTTAVLRGTVIYAQTEPLTLAGEPLDADVSGDTIALDDVYDGLEPGRWVIVSGNRTDVTNVSDVAASELAMIAGVLQGSEATLCLQFPVGFVPLSRYSYTTPANAKGDRLVVGVVDDLEALTDGLAALTTTSITDQQYCDQIEVAPGYYVNAYVPTDDERQGIFTDFTGLLVNPDTKMPFESGTIPMGNTLPGATQYYAWRISAQKMHTILQLANSLAYTYDAASVSVYGNVVEATHGQTVGEILGDGDASLRFQTFALRQSPLTYVSAPTTDGASSTLTVTVNDLTWHEQGDLTEEGPRDRSFITSADDDDTVTVIFGDGVHGARVPSGTANVKAVYRYGIGAAGNVDAGQISQLATQPLGAQGVINPLPSSGGADRDSADDARRNTPMAVMALDRLVSVKDYADFSRTYAGVGKATSVQISDGRKQLVHVTIAGAEDIPIDVNSDLYNNLLQSLLNYGDPYLPVQVAVRRVKLMVVSVNVAILPDYQWEDVEPCIRTAMLAAYGFDARDLGQAAFLSEAVGIIQGVEGVSYCDVQTFDSVAEDVTAQDLASLAVTLSLRQAIAASLARIDPTATDPSQRILPAELVFLTPDIPDTLILTNIGA
jgi:Baseplate J-like protein